MSDNHEPDTTPDSTLYPLSDLSKELKKQRVLVASPYQLTQWAVKGARIRGRTDRVKLEAPFISGTRYSSIKLVTDWIRIYNEACVAASNEPKKTATKKAGAKKATGRKKRTKR